jgi:hypothetical protein
MQKSEFSEELTATIDLAYMEGHLSLFIMDETVRI